MRIKHVCLIRCFNTHVIRNSCIFTYISAYRLKEKILALNVYILS